MAYNDNPSFLKLAGGTMTGILTLSGDPSGANDAANKSYVDAISAGLVFKTAVVCATTVNLNATYLNGALGVGATLVNAGALVAFTVDGITPTINQRVLVKNQTSAFQNGIYTITTLGTGAIAWILTRATDYDQAAEINPGDIVPVSTGTTQANTSWLQTGFVATMGTDLITFQQYQSTPVQTTQYTVLVGGAANTIVGVGPGSSGQVLQSAGNASNPAYSTATYPATASGTGTILRADGTNWSATTSTYPNTNAINTLLYASSANVMSALATANNGTLITSSGGVPSISSTLPSAVQGNITSVGTIASGTWNGTTIAVANGGTSNTTQAAYSLVCGGTTTTGAFQAVSPVATGQVLTSGGVSALPAFSAAPTVTSITFGAGSALNSYVSGTFTPTVGSDSGGSVSYSTQSGRYTRIGDVVVLDFKVVLSAWTAGTGLLNWLGAPYNANASFFSSGSCFFTNLTYASATFVQPIIRSSLSQGYLPKMNSGGSVGYVQASEFAANTELDFTLTYHV